MLSKVLNTMNVPVRSEGNATRLAPNLSRLKKPFLSVSGTSGPVSNTPSTLPGAGFARRFGHDQRGRVALAGHVARAGEDAVITEDALVVWIDQRIAHANH